MKNLIIILSILVTISVNGRNFLSGKLEKFKWDDLEVVYLNDERLPTYSIQFYFADGSLSDDNIKGLTDAALGFLSLGTRRFSQKDIAENLEFYGASASSNVTHEYSSYLVSGLIKDLNPTMKMICHLFKDATYPKKELEKEKKRIRSSISNIANNPQHLANRIFRELSLAGTPYEYPVDGKLKDISKWGSNQLKEKLAYFNEKVKKRIYITGPKEVLNIKRVLTEECGWKGKGKFVRSIEYKNIAPQNHPKITLVSLKKANQAQVRIGRFLSKDEIKNEELMTLASDFLGGGFTSRLTRVLRVQNGLTYSVSSFSAGQKEYGRAGIMTSTGVGTVGKLLEKTKETIDIAASGNIDDIHLQRAKGSLAGSYPFGFESSGAYLGHLMFLDHIEKDYSELFQFPSRVVSFDKEEVAKKINELFSWNRQHIVVVGPSSLKKELSKFGKVEERNYKEFL